MSTPSIAHTISHYLSEQLSTYLEELQQLCTIECPTHHKPGVDEAGAWVHQWAIKRGWEIQTWPDSTMGDSLAVSISGGNDRGPHILIAAHLDTVYPVGTAAERPLRYEGDYLIGPGTADNKSGLLSGLYAMAALEDLDRLNVFGRICLVCGSDEEAGMRVSTAVLRELAPDYDIALVVEPGRENGDIVSARKGGGRFNLEVFGKAAHAGVEPHKGASAILALAQQISALHLLNGMRPSMTLNVGVVQGGTTRNAVPDYARAEIDVRVLHPDDQEPATKAIEQIAQTTYVAGTTATLDGGIQLAPMARTPQIEAMATHARNCAEELDFTIKDALTGGVSYANILASFGLPVLDGLGPIGGLNHSPGEYIEVSSIVPRTALLALLMMRLAETYHKR